jgi:tetratricopeptide (TPR) repeat protein
MSSYLTIKLIPKQGNKKKEDIPIKDYLTFNSWSRNSAIYQKAKEVINPAFAWEILLDENGNYIYDEKGNIAYKDEKFTELTVENIMSILDNIENSINYFNKSLQEVKDNEAIANHYKELLSKDTSLTDANNHLDKLYEVLDLNDEYSYSEEIKEDLEDLKIAKSTYSTLLDFIQNIEYSESAFLGVVCNID